MARNQGCDYVEVGARRWCVAYGCCGSFQVRCGGKWREERLVADWAGEQEFGDANIEMKPGVGTTTLVPASEFDTLMEALRMLYMANTRNAITQTTLHNVFEAAQRLQARRKERLSDGKDRPDPG